MNRNFRKIKLVIYLLTYILLLASIILLLIKVPLLGLIFLIGMGVFIVLILLIAHKGKNQEEYVNLLIEKIVDKFIDLNIGTYDFLIHTIKNIIQMITDVFIEVLLPFFIVVIVLLVSYFTLIFLRWVGKMYSNGLTYVTITLGFLAPLIINFLQYNFANKRLQKNGENSFTNRVNKVVSSTFLNAVEIGLALIFFLIDSNGFFIPDSLKGHISSTFLGYDLTKRFWDPQIISFSFGILLMSVFINFVKILTEKTIYKFYAKNNPENINNSADGNMFSYIDMILSTIAIHITFLPFILLKHVLLTIGFLANLVGDIYWALKDKEVWIHEEKDPSDIVGKLNTYVVKPTLRAILRIFSKFIP